MISQSKQPPALKHFPFIVGIAFGLWGLYLVIHFIGQSNINGIFSILVGLGLIAVGVVSLLLLLKRLKNDKRS
ncbi:MAG: hypothetical protein GX409_09765 [candidate division Zixibacteria bacterium]|jgi:hypothetical protein|nr:hypothetical protein [candidate division Zixibacteria bacterium]